MKEKLRLAIKRSLHSNDLVKLAKIHHTDKWGGHYYARHYQKHFAAFRKRPLNLLEIGVGGDEDPRKGGESLRMWQDYFPKGTIYSIDIHEKRLPPEKRIKIFKGSQDDEPFLKDVFNNAGSLDIIIDDGSHINAHVIKTFKILFPLLNDGGIYAVEDTQTSYWKKYGGNPDDLKDQATLMNFFKGLVDGLNYMEFPKEGYRPSYFDTRITSMHFYHNLIIIYKGANNEKSNVTGRV